MRVITAKARHRDDKGEFGGEHPPFRRIWTRDVNFAFPITARRPDARPAGTVTELAAMLQKAADRRMGADAPQRHSRSCASQPGASARLSPPSGRRNDTQTHLPLTHR